MKKIKNIIIGLTLLLPVFSGCSGFLTVDIPDQLLKKNYWQTRDQVESALNGVYFQLGECIPLFIKWGDIRSDLYSWRGGGNEQAFIEQDIKTRNGLTDWSAVYKGINWANSFLKNVDGVREYDPSITEEELRAMKAEAYTIRALHYFYLVRSFQDVPYRTEPYESDTQSPTAPAVPEEKILDAIEADLKIALEDAREEFSSPEDNYGRITKKAVKAIWADVKLWRGGEENYRQCIGFCEELEAEYRGKMLEPDAWFSMFSSKNSSESIFEYQFTDIKRSDPIPGVFQNNVTFNYKAYSQNVKKIYPGYSGMVTSDTIRFSRTITASPRYGVVGNSVAKYLMMSAGESNYVSRDNNALRKVNFIFYRFREILLIKAEALAMLGQFDLAVEPINQIREATDLETVTSLEFGNGELFFDKLLCERAAELGYEGKQWYSMIRIALHTGFHELVTERVASTTSVGISEQSMSARLQDTRGWFLPYNYTEVKERNQELKQKEYYKSRE